MSEVKKCHEDEEAAGSAEDMVWDMVEDTGSIPILSVDGSLGYLDDGGLTQVTELLNTLHLGFQLIQDIVTMRILSPTHL